MKNPFDNPVYWLDSRARVRERRLWILASFFLSVPLAISCLLLATIVQPEHSSFPGAGIAISSVAVFSHCALLTLLSALGAAQRISQERERRTLPALVNSPLDARRIANGKLLGTWRFSAWLACLTLPFLAAGAIWGGLSIPTLLFAWILNLAVALSAASLALGLSGLFGRSLSAYLATGAALFLWCAVIPIVGGIAMAAAAPTENSVERLCEALTIWHLPMAPQIWLYMGSDTEVPWYIVFCPALVVWSSICLIGRALAIRGLRREVH